MKKNYRKYIQGKIYNLETPTPLFRSTKEDIVLVLKMIKQREKESNGLWEYRRFLYKGYQYDQNVRFLTA